MNSYEIKIFSTALKNFVKGSPLPAEVKRMCLKEAYEECVQQVLREIQDEIPKDKEDEADGDAESISGED